MAINENTLAAGIPINSIGIPPNISQISSESWEAGQARREEEADQDFKHVIINVLGCLTAIHRNIYPRAPQYLEFSKKIQAICKEYL